MFNRRENVRPTYVKEFTGLYTDTKKKELRTFVHWSCPSEEDSLLSNVKALTVSQAVSRWPLTAEARICIQTVHVGFVVDKVALGQVLLRFLRYSPVSIISPSFSMLIYHLGNEPAVQTISFSPST
jgi:hypothetical protein